MKILAMDPGAYRMGYVVLSETGKNNYPGLHGYGHLGLERRGNESKKEPFQEYRLRLIAMWVEEGAHLLDSYKPDLLVNEIVPAFGAKSRGAAAQMQLATTAITTVHVVAAQKGVPVKQVGATTVKTRIGGHKKATKVGVRNGVYALMPGTKERFHSEWTKIFDVPDAFAIGLTGLGYRN